MEECCGVMEQIPHTQGQEECCVGSEILQKLATKNAKLKKN